MKPETKQSLRLVMLLRALILCTCIVGITLHADLIFKGADNIQKSGPLHFDTDNSGNSNVSFTSTNLTGIGLGSNDPKSNLEIAGSIGMQIQVISANVTLGANSFIIADTNAAGGNLEITLPNATTMSGRKYFIKKVDDNHTVTITGNIDNSANLQMTSAANVQPYVELVASGTDWFILDITAAAQVVGPDGPQILTIVADDADNQNHLIDAGDVLVLTFDAPTNQPAAATKTQIDSLIDFDGYTLGADYTGAWSSSNVLSITVVDATGANLPLSGNIQMKANGTPDLKNQYASSDASTDSDVIVGDWGFNLEIKEHDNFTQPDLHEFTNNQPEARQRNLFYFKLISNGIASSTVSEFKLTLSSLNSFANSNLDNFKIYLDEDNDGQLGASETTTVGGTGNIDVDSNQRVTFNTSFNVSQSGNNYFVVGDILGITNMSNGDVATFTMKPDQVTSNVTMIGIQLQTTISVELPLNFGETVYGTSSSSPGTPRIRRFDGIEESWGPVGSMAGGNSTIQWTQTSVNLSDNVMSVVMSDNGSYGTIEAQRLYGSIWYNDWSSANLLTANKNKRAFDVKHEKRSGDAVVVYSNGSANPVYRSYTYATDTWSAESYVFGSAPGSDVVLWVELDAQPGSDEIQLVYADDSNDLFAATWDGSSWSSATTLATDLISDTVKNFAGAYESLTADYVIGWGKSGTAGLTYSVRPAGNSTFTSASTAAYSADEDPRNMACAPDPASDRIAFVYRAGTDDFEAITWSGVSFVDGKDLDGTASGDGTGDMHIGVAWLARTSQAVAIYDDNNVTGRISWATYDASNGWVRQTYISAGAMSALESVVLYGYHDLNKVMALISDSNNDLWSAMYDGSNWTLLNGGVALETDLSNLEGVPFSNAIHEKPLLAITDHVAGQEQNIFTGASSFSSAEAFAFGLRPVSGNAMTVTSMRFDLSDLVGITVSDIADAVIRIDDDNDGVLDGGEITDVGGAESININDTTGTIEFSGSFVVSDTSNYFLLLDINNIIAEDQMKIDLVPAGVSSTDSVVGGLVGSSQHLSGSTEPTKTDDFRIVYGINSAPEDVPFTRIYSLNDNDLSGASQTVEANSSIYWLRNLMTFSSNLETMGVLSSAGSSMSLDILQYDGASWSLSWSDTDFNTQRIKKRAFDMVAEPLSGNIMVVYSNNSSNPRYRYYDGSSWTAETSVFGTAPMSGTSEWIELQAKPGTNELALAFSDSNRDLASVFWDGSSWVASTNTVHSIDVTLLEEQCWDMAYESLSGDFIICWGEEDSDGIYYSTYSDATSTWSVANRFQYLNDGRPRNMRMSADPASDKVAIIFNANSQWVEGALWTGGGMVDGERIEHNDDWTNSDGDRLVDVAFVGTSGNAICVYDDNTGSGFIHWMLYEPGSGWTVQTDFTMPNILDIESVRLVSSSQENKVLALLSDTAGALFGAIYDNNSWTILNDEEAIEDGISRLDGVAFDAYGKQASQILLSDHKALQKSSQFSGTGSLSDVELHAFRLKPNMGSGNTVTNLVLNLENIVGVVQADVSGAEILIDANNDGDIDAGETTSVGGAGTISISGTAGTITFSSSFSVSSANNYIVRADFTNIATGDIFGTRLGASDVSVSGTVGMYGDTTDALHIVGTVEPSSIGDIRVVYGSNDTPATTPKSRVWIESNEAYSPEFDTIAANGTVYWVESAISPIDNSEIVVTLSTGSNFDVECFRWDGSTWSEEWEDSAISNNQTYRMYANIAYESISGNALVVYSNWDANIKYRHYNATTDTWSGETSVFSSNPISGTVRWVRLESQPGTNNIALVYSDSNQDLAACIWDGSVSQWDETNTEVVLDTNIEYEIQRCFDLAYESISGDLVVAWGHRDVDGVRYSTLPFGSTDWSSAAYYTYNNDQEGRFVRLSADPFSDRIAYGTYADGGRLQFAMWTGTQWIDGIYREYNYSGWVLADYVLDIAWVGDTGKAICVYDDEGNTGLIHSVYWEPSSGGWVNNGDFLFSEFDALNSVRLVSKMDEDVAFGLMSDDTGKLFSVEYNGSTWTLHESATELTNNISNGEGAPFALHVKEAPTAIVYNHTAGQVPNALSAGTSVNDASMYAFALRQKSGSNVVLDSLSFSLSGVTGLSTGDFSDIGIYLDENDNGSWDSGETTQIGGSGTASIISTTGNISFTTDIVISAANNYVLRMDVANLVAGDQLTIELNRSGVVGSTNTIGIGSAESAGHFKGDYTLANVGDMRLIYGTSNSPGDYPRHRVFSGNNNLWTPAESTISIGEPANWTEHAISSTNVNEEMAAVVYQTGTGVSGNVMRWNGSSWEGQFEWTNSYATQYLMKGVGIAYERLSGNCMVVFARNNSNPQYSYWNGSSWTVIDQDVFVSAPGSAVRAIEVVSRPGTNEIALVYYDSSNDIHAVIWDGTQWDETNTKTTLTTNGRYIWERCFDAEYESISGDLLVAWGRDSVNGIVYATKAADSTTWSAATTYTWTNDRKPLFSDLVADPNSDRIAMICANDDRWLHAAMWDGENFTDGERLDWSWNNITYSGFYYIRPAWLGKTGELIFVYDDSDASDAIHWGTWNENDGYSIKSDVPMIGMGNPASFAGDFSYHESKAVFVMHDEDLKLWSFHYDGTSWTLNNGGVVLDDAVSMKVGRPFSLAMRQETALILANHKSGLVGDGFEEAGSETDTVIAGFQLYPRESGSHTVTQTVINLTQINGILASDMNGAQIVVDDDGDGVIDAGETTTVGGAGTISISGTSGNIVFSGSYAVNSRTQYLVSANVNNLVDKDTFTTSMTEAKMSASANTVVFGGTGEASHAEGVIKPSVNGDLRLVWGSANSPSNSPRTKVYDKDDGEWGATGTISSANSTIYWTANDIAPSGNQELMAVFSSDGTNQHLNVFSWDGGSWSKDWTSSSMGLVHERKRGFDLAYSQISGNGMVVYSKNDSNLYYRIYASSTWSSEAAVYSAAPGGTVDWVELEARPGSDEIALVLVDTNRDLSAIMWDGSSWVMDGSGNILDSDVENNDQKNFDAAFESLSGNLMVLWGTRDDADMGFFTSTRVPGGTFGARVEHTYTNDEAARYVDLRSEPGSNRIAVATKAQDNQLELAVWDGSSFLNANQYNHMGWPGNGVFALALDWVGTTGKIALVYDDADDGTGLLNWATWDSTNGWQIKSDISMPTKDYTKGVLAQRVHNEDKVVFVFYDDTGKIFASESDGSTMSIYNNAEQLGTVSGIGTSMPLSMALRSQQSLLLANHADGQQGDAFGEATTETDAELFGFKITPSTGVTPTITQLQFKISNIVGLVDGDWAGLEMIIDDDNDGKIEAGETTSVGGAGTVNQGSGTITFSTSFTVSSANNYILRGDFASLSTNDSVKIELLSSGITTQDGEETEGSTTALTHYENRPAKLAEDDISIIYGTTTAPADDPRTRVWDDSNDDWDAVTQSASTNTTINWTINKLHPEGQIELMGVLSDDSSNGNLHLLRWTGSSWAEDWNAIGMTSARSSKRGFDIEYESLTGNAIVVYSNNSTIPVYRTYISGNWSGESNVLADTTGTGVVEWVELIRKPGDNEVALVYADSNNDLFSVIWNGSSWDEANTETNLATDLKSITEKCFDAAYETLTGDLLVAWGATSVEGPVYVTKASDSTTWSSAQAYDYAGDDNPQVLVLKADPASDKIAVAMHTDGNDLEMAMWTGSQWNSAADLDTDIGAVNSGELSVGLSWVGNTGTAVVVYNDNGATATLNWASWTNVQGWTLQTDETVSGMGAAHSIVSDIFTGSDRCMFVIGDSNDDLWALLYDGTSWETTNAGSALESSMTSSTTVPFSMELRPKPYLIFTEHASNQETDAFTESGSETGAELFAFQMKSKQDVSQTINQLTFDLSDVNGIVASDIANAKIYVDDNKDGTISGGETTTVGGTGSVSISSQAGNIIFSTSISVGANTHYILKADVANLSNEDELTLGLSSSGFSMDAGALVVGSVSTVTHLEFTVQPLADNDFRLVYGVSSIPENNPRQRTYDISATDWSIESLTSSTNGTVKWVESAKSPNTTEEVVVTLSDDGINTSLDVLRWDGSSWSNDWSSSSIAITNMQKRGFDVAYSALSGNAIVVYSDNSDSPKYRKLQNGSWTAEGNVFASVPGTGVVEWVSLASRPGSEEIALVYADANSDLHSVIWNGGAWDEAGSETTLDTNLNTITQRVFDLSYETLTGDLLVVWGQSGVSGLYYNTYSDGSWGTSSNYTYVNDEIPEYVVLSPDPASDRIGVLVDASSSDFETSIWLGSSFSESEEKDGGMGTSDAGDQRMALAWVGSTGKAVFMYDDEDLEGLITWGDYEEGQGWNINNAISVPGLTAIESIKMVGYRNSNKVHALVNGTDFKLFSLEYDDSTGVWTVLNGGNPVSSSLSTRDSIPFAASVKYQDILLLTSHPQNQELNAFSGGGSETNAELFSFKLMPSSGNSDITVTQVQFSLSLVSGLVDADFDAIQLVEDADVDGTIDAGESTIGGTGSISISGTSGTITFSSSFSLNTGKSYILSSNVQNLVTGDTFTIDLPTSGVSATGYATIGQGQQSSHYEGASTVTPDEVNDIRLVYGSLTSPDDFPRTRVWDDATSSWSTVSYASGNAGRKRAIQHELSPTSSEELMAFYTDQGATLLIEVSRWTGSSWVTDITKTLNDNRHGDKRQFDIAYESMSGDALFVYSDDGTALYYRTRSGGSWSAEANVFSSVPNGNWPLFIQLVSQPGTDRVALVYNDWDDDLHAVIWDGTQWLEAATENEIMTSLENSSRENFQAAYESLSGDLFICYGNRDGYDGFSVITMEGGTNTWSSIQRWRPAWGQNPQFMRVEPDLFSDHITCVFKGNGVNVEVGIWNGEEMVDISRPEWDADASDVGDMPVATAWMGSTGNAIVVYKDQTESDSISWMYYDTNSLIFQHIPHVQQGDIPILGLGEVQSIVAKSMTTEKVMVAISNSSSDLFLLTYDGTNWTVTNGGTAIETELSATDAVPFDMAIRRPDILYLGTHPAGFEPNAFTATGTVNDAELLSFQLRPRAGGNKTVDQLVISLDDIVGVDAADITNAKLFEDEDGDGVVDGSETTTYGGAGTVSISGSSGNIAFTTSFDVTAPSNLILQVDLANLSALDKMNVSIERDNISASANTVVYGYAENSVHLQSDLSLDVGQARLVYGIRDNHYERGTRPISRMWVDDHNAWTKPMPTIDVDYQAKHILHKVSPVGDEEIALMWMTDYVDPRRLQLMRWNGSSWINDWNEYGGDWDQRYRRGLDVAYCQLSGNAIVVYTDNVDELKYKEWNGSSWTAETEVFPGDPNNNNRVLYVELVEKPGSDEIALLYTDASSDLYGLIWDGDEWTISSNVELETNIRTNSEKCFDAAYETLSGELLVAWGRNGNSGIYYSTYIDGTWASKSRYIYLNNNQPEHLELAPDPNSNKVACTYTAGDAQMHGAMWLGDSWSYGQRLEWNGWGGAGDFNTSVEWVGTTGKVVGVYDDHDETQGIHWFTWDESNSWIIQTDFPVPKMDYLESVMLRTDPRQNKVLGAFLDQYRQLFTAYYNGSTWTLLNGGDPLHTEIANPEGLSFDIVFKQPEALYVTNHSQGQKLNQISSSGTQSNVQLFNFGLFSHTGSSSNVTQLSIQLSDIIGISTSDISNARIFIDADQDGVYDIGETQVGGAGVVSFSSTTGTITFSSSFMVTAATDYMLLVDVANIADGDSITAVVEGSNFTLADTSQLMAGVTSKGIHLYGADQPDDAGDIRVTYGTLDDPADIPRTRFFEAETDDLTSTELPFTSGETIFYLENRLAANANIEYVAVYSNDGQSKLSVAKRTESTWNLEFSSTNYTNTGALRKGFDLELSSVSDNAMVVWADNSNDDILFRSNHSGSWSAEADVFATNQHSGKVEWVELVPKPGTDEFALVYSDSNSDLWGATWDGTQWLTSSQVNFETGLEIRNEKCFDAAYESLSGNLIVAWGKNNVQGLHYKVLPEGNATWSATYRHTYPNDNQPRLVRLVPDPQTNQIAYVGRAEGDHNEVGMWDGYRFFDSRRLDYMWNPGSSKSYLDGAWVGTTGQFVMVYDDVVTSDVMNWISYNRDYRWNNNWEIEVDSSVPGAEDTISVDLETHVSGNKVIAAFSDLSQNLWIRSYNGTSWSTKNSGSPIETNLSTVSSDPFDMVIQNKKQLRVADHISGQVTRDFFSGNTSITSAELYRFKLIPARGSFTVTNLVLRIDDVVGVLGTDLSNAKLFVDANKDGTIGAGETTQVGGSGTVNISVSNANGTITFADDFTLNETVYLILQVDVVNIATGDQITLQMLSNDVSTSDAKDSTGLTAKAFHNKGSKTLGANGDVHVYYGAFPVQGQMLKSRHYDLSESKWSPEFLASAATSPPLWVVAKKSPTHAHEEIIACMTRDHEELKLEVFRYDGTKYVRDWVDEGYGDNYKHVRGFDVAYEKVSGNAMVTYMEGTELRYRTWNGSTWSSEGTVFSSKPNTSNIRFVELAAHPSTNELSVAFNDNERDLFSVMWTGSSWDEANTEKQHSSDVRREYRRCFDIAYSQSSGNLLVAWGRRDADGIDSSTRDNGSNSWTDLSTYTYTNDNRAQWLDLSPDPGSDQIACVIETQSNGEDLEAAMWTGSAWTGGKELDGYILGGYDGDAPVAVTWVGDTGEAILVYDDDDRKDEFRWTKWNGSSWSGVQTNVPIVGMNGIESIQLINAVDNDLAYLLIYDLTTNLYIFTYDGSSWVNTSPSELLMDYGTSDQTQPFSATVKGMLNE